MKQLLAAFLLALAVSMTISPAAEPQTAGEHLVFVSSFAPAGEGAIHAFRLDPNAARLAPAHRNDGLEHPFFMAVSPDRRTLYSIHARQFGSQANEYVSAHAIDASTGALRFLNRQSSLGTASCYLEVDATGKSVLVANYTSGSVAALPVRKDGSLGKAAAFHQHVGSSVNPTRQKEPHAHAIIVSPDNRHAYAADLGLDQILGYRLDPAKAALTPGLQPFTRTPPGAGPRHLTFHPNGRHLYAINELANSVTLFDYHPGTGALFERQTVSTLPDGYQGVSHCADLKITPDGRFLYGTNRGHDSIAVFRIGEDGRLERTGIEPSRGRGPQNLAITPGGELLLCANMPGGNVALFRIDRRTGALTAAGEPVPIRSPSCIMLLR